jgi:hypothetical protein
MVKRRTRTGSERRYIPPGFHDTHILYGVAYRRSFQIAITDTLIYSCFSAVQGGNRNFQRASATVGMLSWARFRSTQAAPKSFTSGKVGAP